MKNGYFQLQYTDSASFVTLYPPEGGGEPISVDELRDYLTSKGFAAVDIVAVKKVIDSLSEPKNIKLADKRGIPTAESMKVAISNDKMSAVVRFYPFSTQGAALTREDIIKELNFRGVKRGIDENQIGEFLSDKHYCTDYVLANGIAPTLGTDASIEYFFNTDPNLKPKLNDDGSVDFFSLSAISVVKEGDKLATLTPEVPGNPGFNVVGDVLNPREVKKLSLKYGRDIELSEDGLTIFTKVNGHASLVEDKVFVSNVYEVSDVDTATGNIDYAGDVCVLGNVRTGFCVRAEGNIEVRGVVESCMLEAGGNVSIARGMNGMSKGAIIAGGNVVSKFLENTTVNAGGYVHSEAILHSTINAKGEVTVTGKKGFITGGVVRTPMTVSAKTIGSTMGVTTEIEVGTDPKLKMRVNSLEQEVASIGKQLDQIKPVLATFSQKIKSGEKLRPEQILYFKQVSTQYQELQNKYNESMDDLDKLMEAMEDVPETEACVKVSEFAYPGTKLTISETTTTLTKPTQHCRFVRDGADVRVKGL